MPPEALSSHQNDHRTRGEDSKLIILGDDSYSIKDFYMNSVCAAGTGSFLDQQAERLRLSIEEFSELSLKSQRPPRIAGRCSVFAKSDMIHLQQIATPVEDIVAGLCFAVARNFKGSIARGRELASRSHSRAVLQLIMGWSVHSRKSSGSGSSLCLRSSP